MSPANLLELLPLRRGHFALESGHHGDTWIDLELLCLRPAPVRRLAAELASRIEQHHVEVVCGPLVEGAFVALMVAAELDLPFTYAERLAGKGDGGLFPFGYEVPRGLRPVVAGKRVAIINDVINAGSAVRGTLMDLRACGAEPVVMGTLAVLGGAAAGLATEHQVMLEALVALPNVIWTPAECPLCAQNAPLTAG